MLGYAKTDNLLWMPFGSDCSIPSFHDLTVFLCWCRLTKELAEAGKKMKDDSVDAQKKTFLKAQIPKMEKEVTELKKKVGDLLESEELDPRGEFYLLAQTLVWRIICLFSFVSLSDQGGFNQIRDLQSTRWDWIVRVVSVTAYMCFKVNAKSWLIMLFLP